MLIRDVSGLSHERVLDRSVLCELLHPDKVPGIRDLNCSIAHAIVPAGEETLPHLLRRSAEIYYILEGCGMMHIGDEQAPVHPGQIVHIPPGARQFIRNTGSTDLVFLCIVAPKWQAEDEILTT